MSGREAIRTGETSEFAGDYLDASAAYSSALNDTEPLVVADALFHLGRVAWKQGRFDEAVKHYEAARALAVQHNSPALRARIENGLGAIHHARGELAQARASYSVALSLARDETQRGRVLLNLGAIANIEGDLEAARRDYERSRSIFQKARYRRGEALSLHNLGMLHADEEHWDEADEAYRLCLDLLEAEGDRQMVAKVLLNRSEVSCARGRLDEALSNCDLAISISSQMGDEVERGEALRWKGHALRLMGQLPAAQKALTEAIRIATRKQIKLLEAEASRDLGATLIGFADLPGAMKRLQHALALFETLGAQREIANVSAELDRLERAIKEPSEG